MEYENEAGVVVVVSRCWLSRTTHNTYYVHLDVGRVSRASMELTRHMEGGRAGVSR